jgi:Mg/Co/Ni transporter MgtE
MTTTPRLLLDTSIAQLQTLASFLAEEMGQYRQRTVVATPEARACKEILLTISVLIPKLQAARYVVTDENATLVGRCVDCEEG